MQPSEREVRLRLPASDTQHPHVRRPGPLRHVGQEHGLAHACRTEDEQDLAGLRERINESAHSDQPGIAADDALATPCLEFTRAWHVPVLSGQYVLSLG